MHKVFSIFKRDVSWYTHKSGPPKNLDLDLQRDQNSQPPPRPAVTQEILADIQPVLTLRISHCQTRSVIPLGTILYKVPQFGLLLCSFSLPLSAHPLKNATVLLADWSLHLSDFFHDSRLKYLFFPPLAAVCADGNNVCGITCRWNAISVNLRGGNCNLPPATALAMHVSTSDDL